jgi:hypothetical protein
MFSPNPARKPGNLHDCGLATRCPYASPVFRSCNKYAYLPSPIRGWTCLQFTMLQLSSAFFYAVVLSKPWCVCPLQAAASKRKTSTFPMPSQETSKIRCFGFSYVEFNVIIISSSKSTPFPLVFQRPSTMKTCISVSVRSTF